MPQCNVLFRNWTCRRNVNYKNICVERIHTNKVKPYEILSVIAKADRKVCCKKRTKGTDINPEKDTAFPIEEMSLRMEVSTFNEYWNTIKKNSDINIE